MVKLATSYKNLQLRTKNRIDTPHHILYIEYGCATETCDARSRWSFMRELHSIIKTSFEVYPKYWGKPLYYFESFIRPDMSSV